MGFTFQKAVRENVWTKLMLGGPSGAGKTYTALRLATGLAKKQNSRIAFIDSEAGRAKYYASEFDFDILELNKTRPEDYIEAIDAALNSGYKIIIVDSITHEWNTLLQEKERMPGNDFTKWGKLTPRHDKFIEKILFCDAHTIVTVRGKDEYVLEEKNGKQVPKKIGLGFKQRDGVEYEYTCTFTIDQDTHVANCTKDNTHLFEGRYEVLTEQDGEKLYDWANSGDAPVKKRTPVVEKTENIQDLQKEIIELCKLKGGSKNKSVMDVMLQYTSNGNPMQITDLDVLKKLKKEIEVVE